MEFVLAALDSVWGLEFCFPAGFVETAVLLVKNGDLPRLPYPFAASQQKSRTPQRGAATKKGSHRASR